MTKSELLKQLKAMGTAQNRKVYARHGITGEQYGVSFANRGKLIKPIKTDHEVAEQLWATDNHDAHILATMITDPEKMTAANLDAWARNLENYPVKDAFRKLASQAPLAKKRMEKWITAGGEWVCSAGWTVLCHLAISSEGHPDTELETYLKSIETTIHGSKNRVKHAMNNALIAIGIRNPHLD